MTNNEKNTKKVSFLEEIFSKEVVWILDDTNVYRVTIHKDLEANLSTVPINGAFFIVNPISGQFFLQIIHTDEWSSQIRLGQLAKIKTAEKTELMIKYIHIDDRPKQIIVTRSGMLDHLQTHLQNEYSYIGLRLCPFHLPVQALIKLEKLHEMIIQATETKTILLNIYDDWLKTISNEKAFERFIVIVSALHTSYDQAMNILTMSNSIKISQIHLWPNLTVEQWNKVEIDLRDLIVRDFCTTNSINIQELSEKQISDIVIGNIDKF
ncbi:pre-mRNA-processing-splicing factor [Anaeramoeba flamelloides]|uniref:Pre-mRNA-processing-splicing factor n=1 Tax=Anaeramoeba flamelloides TaxID=1746091 RepID=A0AAV7YQP1_9EUKA|nr:pre-mRNA-processing-splicing factor [Anaeramoeba flamelloides]